MHNAYDKSDWDEETIAYTLSSAMAHNWMKHFKSFSNPYLNTIIDEFLTKIGYEIQGEHILQGTVGNDGRSRGKVPGKPAADRFSTAVSSALQDIAVGALHDDIAAGGLESKVDAGQLRSMCHDIYLQMGDNRCLRSLFHLL